MKSTKSNRRRPALVPEESAENTALLKNNTDHLLEQIVKDLNDQKSNSQSETKNAESTSKTIEAVKTTPSSTTTSTTTTTSKKPLTEPREIHTEDLFADAGRDIHVYYPSTMCVLNGTSSKLIRTDKRIAKWLWTKFDNSPAFGHFVNTNEAPVVMYEHLVEGVYTFLLRVWTNTDEMSQDTVHVYVHSSSVPESNQANMNQSSELSDNIVQIELDIEPKMFTELVKQEFLNKLQMFLLHAELNLKRPKINVVNTRISTKEEKSTVILDLLIVDQANDLPSKEIIDEMGIYSKSQIYNQNQVFVSANENIVRSEQIIGLLKKKKNFRAYLDFVLHSIRLDTHLDTSVASKQKFSTNELAFSEIDIIDVGQLTCNVHNKNSRLFNCSNHGVCDTFSQKCICNKYWMPNLYMYYIRNEADLTNGNNCGK
jgi:hypothetical protein